MLFAFPRRLRPLQGVENTSTPGLPAALGKEDMQVNTRRAAMVPAFPVVPAFPMVPAFPRTCGRWEC